MSHGRETGGMMQRWNSDTTYPDHPAFSEPHQPWFPTDYPWVRGHSHGSGSILAQVLCHQIADEGEDGESTVFVKTIIYSGRIGRMGPQRGKISPTAQPVATAENTDAQGTRKTDGRPGDRNCGAGVGDPQCSTAENTDGTSIKPTGKANPRNENQFVPSRGGVPGNGTGTEQTLQSGDDPHRCSSGDLLPEIQKSC